MYIYYRLQVTTLSEKMLKWCGLSTYTEILAFSTLIWGGVFLSYLLWLLSWSIVCGFSSSNNKHLTDKVDFPSQIKCHQNLNNEVIYKVENAHWNKSIATTCTSTMWNIQHMPFKVAGPHYYNDFFGRVHILQPVILIVRQLDRIFLHLQDSMPGDFYIIWHIVNILRDISVKKNQVWLAVQP